MVVNGYRRREYEWAEIVAVHLPPGAPWVTLDLADGDTAPVMGIQGSDGDRAPRRRPRAARDRGPAVDRRRDCGAAIRSPGCPSRRERGARLEPDHVLARNSSPGAVMAAPI